MLRKLHWILETQLGLNLLLPMRSIMGVPRFLRDLRRFRKGYRGALSYMPCLHDWHAEGGDAKSEYFWQDLLVARMIFEASPRKHVDIASRFDGFVAHVASFRQIEVFDIRSVTREVPGVIFRQADLMQLPPGMEGYCDSLSCLHALEHFGLGRYGDPIDPEGYRSGLVNMAKLLSKGGVLYLSVPIGLERVEFNANRVFDPATILTEAQRNSLVIVLLKVITQDGAVSDVEITEASLKELAARPYALGVFAFRKTEA